MSETTLRERAMAALRESEAAAAEASAARKAEARADKESLLRGRLAELLGVETDGIAVEWVTDRAYDTEEPLISVEDITFKPGYDSGLSVIFGRPGCDHTLGLAVWRADALPSLGLAIREAETWRNEPCPECAMAVQAHADRVAPRPPVKVDPETRLAEAIRAIVRQELG